MSELNKWFKERHAWIQAASKKLNEQEPINEEVINDLVDLTIREAKDELDEESYFDNLSFSQTSSSTIKLSKLDEIQGINALAPKKPLEFGDENLSIIYGRNGSGKSGYARILKHISGTRNPGNLLGNVFKESSEEQRCNVTYEINGQSASVNWKKDNGSVEDLHNIDIYDSSTGMVYLEGQNEVTYEPSILRFFSDIIDLSSKIAEKIQFKIETKQSRKAELPVNLKDTEFGKWYKELNSNIDEEEINNKTQWIDENEDGLKNLKERIGTENPKTRAVQFFNKRKRLLNFALDAVKNIKKLSNKHCIEIINLKEELSTKENAAHLAAQKAFSSTPLSGIGEIVWIELWEKARAYSERFAYRENVFPVTGKGAKCVLCHQELSEEAKERFISFEEFVQGELKKEADEISIKYQVYLEKVKDLPKEEEIITELDAIGVEDEQLKERVLSIYKSIIKRAEEIDLVDNIDELTPLSKDLELLSLARNEAKSMYSKGTEFLKDFEEDIREEIQNDIIHLEAKKWVSQQKETIKNEVGRLSEIEILKNAKRITNPAVLSRKKGELADELITDAYVKRFNDELEDLGADHLHVKIEKTGVRSGKVLHIIKLDNINDQSPNAVLSEGEKRIVSIAAFLADVTAKHVSSPFIFDDPITSLDEDFEEMGALKNPDYLTF
tara:strand:- start:9 stop:2018 length:2010 start_codon:yes stop_codon:yes gene_type:complete